MLPDSITLVLAVAFWMATCLTWGKHKTSTPTETATKEDTK